MRIGVVYPQTEFGSDPGAIKDYAQTAEALGFTHIVAYDHVLGANPNRPGGLSGPYTHESAFQEPFALFSFMAGLTSRIEFAPGIIILPQRQTALAAKQAATLDVLSKGRLRLGVGLGWNAVEYSALNENFHNRGRRIEEQAEVLRLLWTQPLVSYHGRWHHIEDAGIKPLPVQRPIPIWFGGSAPEALHRMARLGDGWMFNQRTVASVSEPLDLLGKFLKEAGRSWENFGLEARLGYGEGNVVEWQRAVEEWRAAGMTHLSFNTMGVGLDTAEKHIEAVRRFAEAVADY
ncbi:MAG: LLM class F420-dependent oxidoreductase [Chloroflexi bacterium]|nr:LLM class F420-dependent oxidoreductase [Chloroflexota bacterium]